VGTASQGYTLEEAVANLREATTELYLEEEPAAVQRTGEVTATLFEADVLTAEKQNL
jgi:predicted RNase H-like HicB family nuclease